MPQFPSIGGIGTRGNPEAGFLCVYNGSAAIVVPGTPLCWSMTAKDGKTVVLPTALASTINTKLFAGVAQKTIGTTDDYSPWVQCYGFCTALTLLATAGATIGNSLKLSSGLGHFVVGDGLTTTNGPVPGEYLPMAVLTQTPAATSETVASLNSAFVRAL